MIDCDGDQTCSAKFVEVSQIMQTTDLQLSCAHDMERKGNIAGEIGVR